MNKRILAGALCAAMMFGIVPNIMKNVNASSTVSAKPTRDSGQKVYVDDVRVYPTGYLIGGNNYFKLRDVGTLVGFGVEWNGNTQTVEISTTRTTPSSAGISDAAVAGATAKLSKQNIAVDGKPVSMTAYSIGGNNYVKLRDIGKQVNFGVSFDAATASVKIDTDAPYVEESNSTSPNNTSKPAVSGGITSWNTTMLNFADEMYAANSNDECLSIAKKYAPTITGKADATVEDVIAKLETLTDAPIDARGYGWLTENFYHADKLRIALGQEKVHVDQPSGTSGGSNNNSNSSTNGSGVSDVNNGTSSSGFDAWLEEQYAAITDDVLRQWELDMVDAINEERRKAGVPELKINQQLMGFAQYWAVHIIEENNVRHATKDDIKEYDRAYGTSLIETFNKPGENICTTGRNPVENNMRRFMASEGHRANILNPNYKSVGVGYGRVGTEMTCVQEFSSVG